MGQHHRRTKRKGEAPTKMDCRIQVGTLILTSALEDLVWVHIAGPDQKETHLQGRGAGAGARGALHKPRPGGDPVGEARCGVNGNHRKTKMPYNPRIFYGVTRFLVFLFFSCCFFWLFHLPYGFILNEGLCIASTSICLRICLSPC